MLISLELQYFIGSFPLEGRVGELLPFAAVVDEAPFAVLPDGGSSRLKRLCIVESGRNDPLLLRVDKAPLSGGGLDGCQSFAVGTDGPVFGALG